VAASQGLELGSAWWLDVPEIIDSAAELSGIGGEKKELTVGARVSATGKRKGATGEKHKLEEKAPFGECTKGSRADWAKRRGGSLRGKAGRCREHWVGWAGLQIIFKQEMIFKFQCILEFGKTLRNSTRRFRRNLDMRIFSKFF
jgi:hypothetical protein